MQLALVIYAHSWYSRRNLTTVGKQDIVGCAPRPMSVRNAKVASSSAAKQLQQSERDLLTWEANKMNPGYHGHAPQSSIRVG
jgi:hypothetical protein